MVSQYSLRKLLHRAKVKPLHNEHISMSLLMCCNNQVLIITEMCVVCTEVTDLSIDPLSLPEGPVEGDADDREHKPSSGHK